MIRNTRNVKSRVGADVEHDNYNQISPRVDGLGKFDELSHSIGNVHAKHIDTAPRCVSLSARTMDVLEKWAQVTGIGADALVESWVTDTLVDPVLDDVEERAAAGLARRLCWLSGVGEPGRPGRLAPKLGAVLDQVARVVEEVRLSASEEAARRGASADKVRAFCHRHFRWSKFLTPASAVRAFLRFSDGQSKGSWEAFAAAYPRISTLSRWRANQVDQALSKAVKGMRRARRLAAERAEEARNAAL